MLCMIAAAFKGGRTGRAQTKIVPMNFPSDVKSAPEKKDAAKVLVFIPAAPGV